MERYLYDEIGNQHPRKNQYLIDVLDGKKPNRATHPYIQKKRQLDRERRAFEKSLRAIRPSANGDSRVVADLRHQLELTRRRAAFYEDRADFSYDDELAYKENRIRMRNLPEILEQQLEIERILKDLDDTARELKGKDFTDIEAQIRQKIDEEKARERTERDKLKSLRRQKQISAKAYDNEKKQLRRRVEEEIRAIKNADPRRALKGERNKWKHQKKISLKTGKRVMESDIADLRRKIPMETEDRVAWHAWAGLPIPGLGQLLNGQPLKAICFFLGTLFNYFVAIPYALGEGNYRGDGIAGLISLAEGGKRLDRSIIFMIEGIIAIVLLLIAIAIFIFAFRDAHNVDKKRIRGVRPNNTFQTRQNVRVNGFPYLVSTPALLVILFIVIVPILTTIFISFTNYDPQHQSKFVWSGFINYKQIFLGQGIAGGPFWLIMGWTLIWTLLSTSLAIFIGFSLALLLHQDRVKGKRFFRTIYLLPWAVPAFITIMFFSLMFANGGILTEVMHSAFNTDIIVKNSTWGTRITLILLQGWLGSSYVFLLSTGVLQGIPGDLYEAAMIDGATPWQRISKITLPLVLYQTAPLLVGQYTFNFNNFSIIYLFNGGGPFNPTKYGNLAGSSDLLISYIYKLTIEKQYQGIGAAITLVISIGLMIFAFIGFKNSKAFKEERL
ncbi:MAG: ABC transporter permease subunit [Saccharofermentanales bacterium]|jgi:arabinogalactan oligomer/maltooligosaccharide transport system permease protein